LKISIITVVKNGEKTILNSINSLKNQNFNNYEHIIIDGNSSDRTKEIILKNCDLNKTIFVSEEDEGLYFALNKAIKLCSGDIIGVLHSDDIYANSSVLKQIEISFYNREVQIVYGDSCFFSGNKITRSWNSGNVSISKLEKGWMPPHTTIFIRLSALVQAGLYDTKYKISADYDFTVKCLYKYKMKSRYIPILVTKMQNGGISNNGFRNIILKIKEDSEILRKYNLNVYQGLILKRLRKINQFLLI